MNDAIDLYRPKMLDHINYGSADKLNDPRRQENARYRANLMIAPNPNSKDSHWDNAAKTLLQGLMMFVATAPIDAPMPPTKRSKRTGGNHR